jgi:hypothetical protein
MSQELYAENQNPGVEEVVEIDPNVEIAASLLTQPVGSPPDNLRAIYAANEKTIDTVNIVVDRSAVSVLHMSELLLGHQDSAVDFYEKTVEQVANLPADMKPDFAVVSGFLQGDFKFIDKPRRATLVPELNSMDQQFKYARQALEKLQNDVDIPIIYNMSNDDRRIAEEATVETFRKMQNLAKSQEDINWARIDKMRQSPQWNTHYKFQVEQVFPYCLRSGRRLYSAEEMSAQTGGEVNIEEYFVLFGAEQAAKVGAEVPAAHAEWLEKAEATQNKEIIITDDANLEITTEGREYTDWVRHYIGFSSKPMYQNHMKTGLEAIAGLAADGQKTPDMLITQHNQEEVGVGNQGAWAISVGGMIRARNFMNAPGSRTDVAGDLSKRLVVSRKRIPEPSASIHERTDDGRYIATFLNETLNEKSFSIPERMTIAELCDLQTGSITARPDVLAKYLDYIRTRALGERATAIFFGGDMMHGRNYPHFPSESQMTGLMAMDSQEAFNTAMFQQAFEGISADELEGLQKVLVQPGNHEWNSGTLKWHGYSFTTYMRGLFERMYARAGFSDAEIAERVQSHEATITPKGEYASGYTGIEYFGDMGVLIQHYMLERGGKGSGGDLPVYQAHHFINGGGDLMKNVDVYMAGHWHHPQHGLFGNKLALVGGSMAGLSDYELKRGYRPTIAGTLIHMGGGLPVQIESISEQALHAHQITTGGFAGKALLGEGYKDDRSFDPIKHGIFLPDRFPKSALQKKILQMMRDASQRANSVSVLK